MRRQYSVGIGAFVLMFGAAVCVGDTLESAEKAISEQMAKIKSMQFKMKSEQAFEMGTMKTEGKSEGTYEYTRKGDKTLFRSDMTTKTVTTNEGKEEKQDNKTQMVCDGDFVYIYNDGTGGKSAMKSKVTDQNTMIADQKFFENMQKEWDLKLLSDESVDGKSCYVIEATAKSSAAAAGQMNKMTMWFDKGSGVTLKMTAQNPAGKTVMSSTCSDVKMNADIPADRFTFKLPEGVQMMDMTQNQQPQAEPQAQPEQKQPEEAKEPAKEPEKPADEKKKDDKKLKLPKIPGKKP